MTKQSVLTAAGEQFLADILQEYRDGDDDYFISDICEEWSLEYVHPGHVKIPDTYGDYGALTTAELPLLLKTQFGLRNPTEIQTHPYDEYPYFHNEVFGEICLWKEAQRRGEPHTDLFAPVFRYDESTFEWALVAFATDIPRENLRSARKQVEERGRKHGWVPDDTEVGLFDGTYVAIDYGLWWRQNDEWITDVNDRPYIDRSTLTGPKEPPSDTKMNSELRERDGRENTSATPSKSASIIKRLRCYRWLSSLFS